MKKIYLLFIVLTGMLNIANAQWQQTNGPWGGGNISCFAVSGNNIFAGVAVPVYGTGLGVFLSTDNGNSWTAVNTGLTNLNIQAIAISGSNIFAGTNGGGIFLTTQLINVKNGIGKKGKTFCSWRSGLHDRGGLIFTPCAVYFFGIISSWSKAEEERLIFGLVQT